MHVNFMTATCFDRGGLNEKTAKSIFYEQLKMFPKYTYQLVNKFGDYYYEPMSHDETWKIGVTI